MKKVWITTLLMLALLSLFAQPTIPRVYVQKLVLEDGTNPFITWYKDQTSPEYLFRAWIWERPDEILSTETHTYHHLAITQVGDGKKVPFMVVSRVNLGNFPSQWHAGETLHLELTHKETGQKVEWDVYIPEGTATIMLLDTPQIIPPYKEVKSEKIIPKTDNNSEKSKESNSSCSNCPHCH
mgnify:FL=1